MISAFQAISLEGAGGSNGSSIPGEEQKFPTVSTPVGFKSFSLRDSQASRVTKQGLQRIFVLHFPFSLEFTTKCHGNTSCVDAYYYKAKFLAKLDQKELLFFFSMTKSIFFS